MPLIRMLRSYRRTRMKRTLTSYARQGARVAHLPAFLDRYPRPDLHRAYQSAFMRGFVNEQNAMP